MRVINKYPGRLATAALGALPFLAIVVFYMIASDLRRRVNPSDRLLPSLQAMGDAMWQMAAVPDKRSGDLLLWVDTASSLQRLGIGIGFAVLIALVLGIAIGSIPHMRAALAPVIAAISLVPPITILPILFIVFGLGETSKIMLIALGTAPVMVRSIAQGVLDLPREQIIKVQTLGASVWQMIMRVVLPQMLPRLITAIRLGLVPAWIFLISAEAIASTSGLGYRIFLVRRYFAMDVILPYVIWITLIAFILDRALLMFSRRAFGWFHLEGASL